MRERISTYDGHKLTVFIPENDDERDYLKNQNMHVIIAEQGLSLGEMFTAKEFYTRLASPSVRRIPIVSVTSARYGVYDTVNSIDNL